MNVGVRRPRLHDPVTVSGQSRILYSMSRDGLLPALDRQGQSEDPHPRSGARSWWRRSRRCRRPFPIDILGELVSMGTLYAFGLICAGVLYLRIKHPEPQRAFKTQLIWFHRTGGHPWLCFPQSASCRRRLWQRLFIWMGIGLVVHFGYAYWHSRQHHAKIAAGAPAE